MTDQELLIVFESRLKELALLVESRDYWKARELTASDTIQRLIMERDHSIAREEKLRAELAEAKKGKEKWETIARNIEDFRDAFVRGEKAENENLRSQLIAAQAEVERGVEQVNLQKAHIEQLTTAQSQAEKDKATIERLIKELDDEKADLYAMHSVCREKDKELHRLSLDLSAAKAKAPSLTIKALKAAIEAESCDFCAQTDDSLKRIVLRLNSAPPETKKDSFEKWAVDNHWLTALQLQKDSTGRYVEETTQRVHAAFNAGKEQA